MKHPPAPPYRYDDTTPLAINSAISPQESSSMIQSRGIKELKRNRIWGFTIGGAVLEGKFVKNGTAKEQIEAVRLQTSHDKLLFFRKWSHSSLWETNLRLMR